jgi:hypothetical protein
VSSENFLELLREAKCCRPMLKTQTAMGPLNFLRVKMLDALKPEKTEIRGYVPSKVGFGLLFLLCSL